jgi:hypothetical protein
MKELLNKIEHEILKRNIDTLRVTQILSGNKDITSRRIIYGYASVDVVDREGQRIPIPALKNAVTAFMSKPFFRNVNVFHSDITIGRVLPKWTNPETGEIYVTKVDDKGWLVVCEIRNDIEVANKTWNEIVKGNIRSFSVAGSSKDKLRKRENGIEYEQINDLEFVEVTCCEVPVNQMSRFEVLYNPQSISI